MFYIHLIDHCLKNNYILVYKVYNIALTTVFLFPIWIFFLFFWKSYIIKFYIYGNVIPTYFIFYSYKVYPTINNNNNISFLSMQRKSNKAIIYYIYVFAFCTYTKPGEQNIIMKKKNICKRVYRARAVVLLCFFFFFDPLSS